MQDLKIKKVIFGKEALLRLKSAHLGQGGREMEGALFLGKTAWIEKIGKYLQRLFELFPPKAQYKSLGAKAFHKEPPRADPAPLGFLETSELLALDWKAGKEERQRKHLSAVD